MASLRVASASFSHQADHPGHLALESPSSQPAGKTRLLSVLHTCNLSGYSVFRSRSFDLLPLTLVGNQTCRLSIMYSIMHIHIVVVLQHTPTTYLVVVFHTSARLYVYVG